MVSSRFLLLTILFLAILSQISASCDSGEIDINSASLEDLDKLYGIGPVKAQAIVDSRPFETIDDLIDVNGIGNATLEGIKSQGLACVEKEEVEEESIEDNPKTNEEVERIENKSLELKIISLEAQPIKSNKYAEIVRSNYLVYLLIIFGFGIIALLITKKNKNGLR